MAFIISAKNRNKSNKTNSDSTSHSSKISTSHLENLLEQLKNEGLQSTTKLSYYKTWTKFNQFIIQLDDIPKSWEIRTSLYCTYLICEKKLQSSTVRSYVSAIKCVLQNDGYMWDDGKVLLNTLTKSCKLKNDCVKTRLPIQKGLLELILYNIRKKFDEQPYLEAMYITAFLLFYHGLMRVGELAQGPHAIKAVNVHESRNHKKLLLVLYTSKTHGLNTSPQQIKILSKGTLEVRDEEELTHVHSTRRTTGKFCPVEWCKSYIEMRQPIVDVDEQFLIFSDGSNVQPCHLRKILREILYSLDLDAKIYDTHSFRIGKATDLFKVGVTVEQIKQLGRWKSNAVYKYLRQ